MLDEEGIWTVNQMVSGTAMDGGRCRMPTLQVKDPITKQVIKEVSVMIFPFLFFLLHFSLLIPFRPHSLSIPMSLLHKALLVSLIYDSQALRLTSTSIPALPGTALWLVLTPFHLEAAPPLYFPSVWLVMTQPLSFTGLPFALPSTYKYLVG